MKLLLRWEMIVLNRRQVNQSAFHKGKTEVRRKCFRLHLAVATTSQQEETKSKFGQSSENVVLLPFTAGSTCYVSGNWNFTQCSLDGAKRIVQTNETLS